MWTIWRAPTNASKWRLEKAWAVEAGLGWTGGNSLLITPEHGSFVLLGLLVLDAECDEYDVPLKKSCPYGCTRCLDACPAGAIVAPKIIDAGKCVARVTLEKNPPPDMRTYNWIAGCDACQSVCPYNQNTPLATDPRFATLGSPRSRR